jgi:hypothetical protein
MRLANRFGSILCSQDLLDSNSSPFLSKSGGGGGLRKRM